MLQNTVVHAACVETLGKLSVISDEVYNYYFDNDVKSITRKPFFKLKRSVIEYYDFVYEFSTAKPSYDEKLFELFKTALQQHLLKHMSILNDSIGNSNLIHTFNLIWDSYTAYLLILSKRIFAYLNRFYLPANDQSLQKAGIKQFTRIFLTESTLRAFFGAFCEQLSRARQKLILSHNELYHFSESLTLIGNNGYFTILKETYLREAIKFYEAYLARHSAIEPINYLNYVNNLWHFEQLLQKKSICLIESEVIELFELFNNRLIANYTDKLINHPYGFKHFLKYQQVNKLKIVHKVYSRMEGFEKLRRQLYEFILSEGMIELNEKSKNQNFQHFVQSLYQFYMNYSKLISEGFSKNEEMQVSLKNSMEKLVSKFDNMAEILFKFTRAALDSANFQAKENIITILFQQLSYKDEFLSFYLHSLEQKILNGKLVYSTQKNFIDKIKQICGSQSTNSLEKILEDFIESATQDIAPAWHQQNNFNAKILSLYLWEKKFENQAGMNLTLFSSLKNTWSSFEEAYCAKYPKKKLIILPYETKLILEMHTPRKTIMMKCNLIQACILLYAAQASHRIIKEEELIVELTLEKSFLIPTLKQIPQLMIQTDPGIYELNWDFKTEEQVVDMSSRIQQETKFTKNIHQDRDILIQAAIVKITKNKKEIMFEELAIEISHRIKLFKPHPTNIKAAVEKLIKKDLIEECAGGILRYIE